MLPQDISSDMTLADYITYANNYDLSDIEQNSFDIPNNISELLDSNLVYSDNPLIAGQVASKILEIVTKEMSSARGATIFKRILGTYILAIDNESLKSAYVLDKIVRTKELVGLIPNIKGETES